MDTKMEDFYNGFPTLYQTFDTLTVFQTPRVYAESKIDHIKAAIDSVTEIFRKYDIPTEDDSSETDPRCVYAYKYLLLNTSFKCQSCFMRDEVNLRLVDKFHPSLSTFMFLEILRELEYEMILAESLLHLPLDLCVELLVATGNFVHKLHYERRLNFVFRLISRCHKKLMMIAKNIGDSLDFVGSLDRLFVYTQQLITLLTKDALLWLDGLTDLKKSEHIGFFIKGLVSLTTECLKHDTENIIPSPEMTSMYYVSFGEPITPDKNSRLSRQMCILNQEFLHVIIKRIREIDVLGHVYNMWNLMESPENPSVTLQASIRSDFYRFMEFLKGYDYLRQRDYLAECFLHFNPQPLPAEVHLHLDFSGLSSPSEEERKTCIKDVLKRYKEWDHSTIDVIRKHRNLLDKYDITMLSRYLAFILPKLGHANHKNRVAMTIRAIIYDRTKSVLAKYSQRRYRHVVEAKVRSLVPWWSAANFKKFMADGKNVASPKYLPMTLSFAINDPFGVASLIAKSAIGGTVNKATGSSALILLYPALCLSRAVNIVQVSVGKSYCCKWDPRKFIELADLMMAESMLTANEIVNRFISSWLYDRKPKRRKLLVMLRYCQRTLTPKITAKEEVVPFISAITHTMAAFRSDNEMSKISRDITLEEIQTTAVPFLKMYTESIKKPRADHIIIAARNSLSLIDRYKPPFWVLSLDSPGLQKTLTVMICMWAHDCFMSFETARRNQSLDEVCPHQGPSKASDLNRFADEFLQNAFIVSTQKEYVELAMMAVMGGNCFWNYCKVNSYEKTIRMTLEAALYFLEVAHISNPHSFACMMLNVAKLTKELLQVHLRDFNTIRNQYRKASYQTLRNVYDYYKPLRKYLYILANSIKHTKFSSLYSALIVEVNHPRLDEEPRGVAIYKVIGAIDEFANMCLKIPHDKVKYSQPMSSQPVKCLLFNNFVNDCLSVSEDIAIKGITYGDLCTSYKLLSDLMRRPNMDQIVG